MDSPRGSFRFNWKDCPPSDNIRSRARPTIAFALSTHNSVSILGAMAKEITRSQADRKRAQAVTFMERIGLADRAEEFDQMSTDEYAEHKGFTLNPTSNSKEKVPALATPTKSDLEDQIEQAVNVLDDAYQPESSREDLVAAVSEALDILRNDGDDESDDTDPGRGRRRRPDRPRPGHA